MSHLTLETIARLVEETPSAAESAHLDACELCRAELGAMREQVTSLSTLPDMSPPPDAWNALETRLTAEGLIRGRRGVPFFAGPRMMQAAAAILLFLGGTMAGRMTAAPAPELAQGPVPMQPIQHRPAAQSPTRMAEAEPEPDVQDTGARDVAPAPARGRTGAVLASASSWPTARQPRTLEEATALLRQTEELYLDALTRFAELATDAEPGDPVSRLAALQSIVMTTQAALNQAPADPVINGYHLTALAQRDATLRQVAAASTDRWY